MRGRFYCTQFTHTHNNYTMFFVVAEVTAIDVEGHNIRWILQYG